MPRARSRLHTGDSTIKIFASRGAGVRLVRASPADGSGTRCRGLRIDRHRPDSDLRRPAALRQQTPFAPTTPRQPRGTDRVRRAALDAGTCCDEPSRHPADPTLQQFGAKLVSPLSQGEMAAIVNPAARAGSASTARRSTTTAAYRWPSRSTGHVAAQTLTRSSVSSTMRALSRPIRTRLPLRAASSTSPRRSSCRPD